MCKKLNLNPMILSKMDLPYAALMFCVYAHDDARMIQLFGMPTRCTNLNKILEMLNCSAYGISMEMLVLNAAHKRTMKLLVTNSRRCGAKVNRTGGIAISSGLVEEAEHAWNGKFNPYTGHWPHIHAFMLRSKTKLNFVVDAALHDRTNIASSDYFTDDNFTEQCIEMIVYDESYRIGLFDFNTRLITQFMSYKLKRVTLQSSNVRILHMYDEFISALVTEDILHPDNIRAMYKFVYAICREDLELFIGYLMLFPANFTILCGTISAFVAEAGKGGQFGAVRTLNIANNSLCDCTIITEEKKPRAPYIRRRYL